MVKPLKVLLIEGKRNIARRFASDLEKKGYSLQIENSGSKGLDALKFFSPNVVVINAASLRTNGQRLASWFRNSLPDTPICLIVAEDETALEVENVNFVLRLPFTAQKLVNRFHTIENNSHKGMLEIGDLVLNPDSGIVVYKDKEVRLTPRQCDLLERMMTETRRDSASGRFVQSCLGYRLRGRHAHSGRSHQLAAQGTRRRSTSP